MYRYACYYRYYRFFNCWDSTEETDFLTKVKVVERQCWTEVQILFAKRFGFLKSLSNLADKLLVITGKQPKMCKARMRFTNDENAFLERTKDAGLWSWRDIQVLHAEAFGYRRKVTSLKSAFDLICRVRSTPRKPMREPATYFSPEEYDFLVEKRDSEKRGWDVIPKLFQQKFNRTLSKKVLQSALYEAHTPRGRRRAYPCGIYAVA